VISKIERAALMSIAVMSIGWPCGEVRATVPLSPGADGHITVPAFVNGQGPFPFILDTGADNTAIYQGFAKQQRLTMDKARDVEGQTGTISSPTLLLKTLSIDRHSIHHIVADSLPDRRDAGLEAGVAGNDLLDGTIVIFDFPCSTVQIRVKPVDITQIVSSDSVEVRGGTDPDSTVLTLPVALGGIDGVAYLDTGSRDTRVSPSFAAAAHVDPASAVFRDGDPIFGVGSKGKPSRIGPVGDLHFAGMTIAQARARVIDLPFFGTFSPGNPRPAMILGMDILQAYRLVYDHEAKRFWFTQSRCKRTP
jgi:hypothetical protein